MTSLSRGAEPVPPAPWLSDGRAGIGVRGVDGDDDGDDLSGVGWYLNNTSPHKSGRVGNGTTQKLHVRTGLAVGNVVDYKLMVLAKLVEYKLVLINFCILASLARPEPNPNPKPGNPSKSPGIGSSRGRW